MLFRSDAEIWAAEDGRAPEGQIADSLKWAAELHAEEEDPEHLVVVAGSLYLVADLYRLLRGANA